MRKLFQIIPIPNDSIQRPLWWFDFVSPKWLARKVRAHFQLANIIAQKVRVRITLIHSHTLIQTLISTTHTMAPLKRKKVKRVSAKLKQIEAIKITTVKSHGAHEVRNSIQIFPRKIHPQVIRKLWKCYRANERASEHTNEAISK